MNCKHFFCRNCISDYTSCMWDTKDFAKLKCPLSYCNEVMGPEQLHDFLEEGTYKKLIKKRLLKRDTIICVKCEKITKFDFKPEDDGLIKC